MLGSQISSGKYKELKQTGRSNEGKNDQRNPPRSRPLLVEIIGRYTAEERDREKEQEDKVARRIAFWTMVTGAGTVGAAVLALVAAGIFWRQLGTMQAQLTEQEADFRIDQRPILALTDVPPGVPS